MLRQREKLVEGGNLFVQGLGRVEGSFAVCMWEEDVSEVVDAAPVVGMVIALAKQCKSVVAFSQNIPHSDMMV